MKSALLYGHNDLRVEERPDPKAGEGQAVIRIHASGVCPSDIRSYTAATAAKRDPWTPGHEIAGVVTELGSGDTGDLQVGDRVAVDWRGVCGRCHQCVRGAANFCENLVKYPIAGFADATVMPVAQLTRLADGVSFEAASFAEPLACVVNAHRALPLPLAENVLVVGAGPIGLLHTQVARARGGRVIVTDMKADRLKAARELGAHDVAEVANQREAVLDLTDGRGADIVIVTVGIPAVIEAAFGLVAKNGAVNLFAGTHPKGAIALNPDVPHYDQVAINGSHDFIPNDFATALRLLRFGQVDVAPLISHRFPLAAVAEAFETTRQQRGLKSLVVAEGEK
ncbi:alcohol dehydrogenase catalytic domain-containing protein [Herbidospora sp. NEAU-GS84]|uniref:Alcohol dehydrogenase catalytic domain-containing protein n=1 Tax=Herbidospora solisilvae TaxID=2696284 RepID=A0A7C9J5M5_9ACTN|nr:zinc-binding dehydrogenase [Herbidospora solisilvae]NAS25286.1 alcohol dehydrogenase catalytic domain-containing protein [Herbidospora solisilvae]